MLPECCSAEMPVMNDALSTSLCASERERESGTKIDEYKLRFWRATTTRGWGFFFFFEKAQNLPVTTLPEGWRGLRANATRWVARVSFLLLSHINGPKRRTGWETNGWWSRWVAVRHAITCSAEGRRHENVSAAFLLTPTSLQLD